MEKQRDYQKKPTAPTRSQPTKTSVKSPVHPVEELQAAIGNREMGRLMETNRLPHPSSPFPKLQGELPLLGGMMPVSQATIQRQPLFRGLSQELVADTAMALPATGAVIQPKLTLGTPGDMYEQEADRVARQVVDEIHSSPFREPNTQSPGERKPDGGEALRVQRQITVRAAGDAGGELSSEWETQLQRSKSGGQPLSPSVKEPMERAFGADFGGVRVHTGAQADMLAKSIQAKAFTTGQDVFFRQGTYEPGSRGGQELLAHELTHVVQQKRSSQAKKTIQRVDRVDWENFASLMSVVSGGFGLMSSRMPRAGNYSRLTTILGLVGSVAGGAHETTAGRYGMARDILLMRGALLNGLVNRGSNLNAIRGELPRMSQISHRADVASIILGAMGMDANRIKELTEKDGK